MRVLKRGALIVLAVLLTAQAPIPTPRPSQIPSSPQSGTADADKKQESAAPPNPPKKIQASNTQAKSVSGDSKKPNKTMSWLDWFSNNDHWMVFGTLILAAAATFQVEIARRTAKRQLRAYVLVEGGGVYDASRIGVQATQPNTLLPAYTNFVAVDLTLKNSGQTPASHVLHWAQLAISDTANEHLLIPPANLEESQASVVGPGQIITKSLLYLPFPLAQPILGDIITHQKGIYVYGKIVYRDIFKRTRTTTYRLRYSGTWPPIPSGTFLFSLAGNDFD